MQIFLNGITDVLLEIETWRDEKCMSWQNKKPLEGAPLK